MIANLLHRLLESAPVPAAQCAGGFLPADVWTLCAVFAAVFGACISYAMVNMSHILLRIKAPDVERGYRTPGGVITTGIAFTLSCVALVSTFFVDLVAACCVFGLMICGMIYYYFYARHHLVANAPEEAFASEKVEKKA